MSSKQDLKKDLNQDLTPQTKVIHRLPSAFRTKSSLRWVKLLPALTAAFLSPSAALADSAPNLIIKNARIYTANERRPWASAMAVKDGRIIAVGDDVQTCSSADSKIIDAKGRLIMPGFHDCHIHLEEGGVELKQCRLNEAKNKDDLKRLLSDYLFKQSDATGASQNQNYNDNWLIAVGLPLPALSNGNAHETMAFDRHFLDQISNKRPIIVYSEDAHSCWLNTRGMKLAGLNGKSAADSHVRGVIEKDDRGEPTGCLREGAMTLATDHVPAVALKKRVKDLEEAVTLANSLGITSIQDAHATDEVLETYLELARHGRLNIKVCAALHTGNIKSKEQFARLERQRRRYTTKGRLRATAAKIFADGVIETGTAALLEPYSDAKNSSSNSSSSSGNLNYSPEELNSLVQELDRRHFQIHIHAIGDRAVRASLDALEKAIAANSPWQRRHLMAHLQLVNANDIPRFSTLGITAVCQYLWAFQDKYIKELTVPKLGERTWQVYPFKSLLDSGCRMAGGSDWTVSSMNPLEAMQVAITRQAPSGQAEPPLNEKQIIPLDDVCRAYTTGGAWINNQDEETGSLECGKCADFIMLDKDIFKLPPREISTTHVLATVLDGQVVFGSLDQ